MQAAPAASTAAVLLGTVLVLILVIVLVVGRGRRRVGYTAPRRGSPIALGIFAGLEILGGLLAAGFWLTKSFEADGVAKLPRCATYAAATSRCQITVPVTVVSHSSYTTSGRNRTTHYYVSLQITGESPVALSPVELESGDCWVAMQDGGAYSGVAVGQRFYGFAVPGQSCRTSDSPGTQAQGAGIVACIFIPLGAMMLWAARQARRKQQRGH